MVDKLNKVRAPDSTSNPGLAVDAGGNPVIDPTKNVLDLVTASERRMDDLAVAAEKLSSVKHDHSRELIRLNADYSKELREAETKRLDAIRAVDVAAASVIANQVSTSAEALRSLVATTATTLAAQTTSSFTQLSDRIAQLERTSYEGSGKAAVADPALARMLEAIEALRSNMAKDEGKGTATSQSTSMIFAVIGAVGLIATIAISAFR